MAVSKSAGNSPSAHSDDGSSSSDDSHSPQSSLSAPGKLGSAARKPERLIAVTMNFASGRAPGRVANQTLGDITNQPAPRPLQADPAPSAPKTDEDGDGDEDDGHITPRARFAALQNGEQVRESHTLARIEANRVLQKIADNGINNLYQTQTLGHNARKVNVPQQQRPGQFVPRFVNANIRDQVQLPSSLSNFDGSNIAPFNLRQQIQLGPQSVHTINRRNLTTFAMNQHGQFGGGQPMPAGMANGQAQGIFPASNNTNNTNANEAYLLRTLQAQLPADEAPRGAQCNGVQADRRHVNGNGNGHTGGHPQGIQRMQTPVPLHDGTLNPDDFTPTSYHWTPRGSDHSSDQDFASGPFEDAANGNGAVAFHKQLGGGSFSSELVQYGHQLGGDPFSTDLIQHGAATSQLSHVIQPIESDAVALHSVVPEHIRRNRSRQLNELTTGPSMRPTGAVALHRDNFPFVNGAGQAKPTPERGVVKLKNIPYGTKRNEIIALMGRNSRMLNDKDEGVHIIMERVTCKTNDAYVEFMSHRAAVDAVARYDAQKQSDGRPPRLGDRPVEMQLSSQAALMRDLFPHAKGVFWGGAEPTICQDIEGYPWKSFKGFITIEEMTMIVKHVEVPQRSPFSKDCPERPFECMISTLKKFPWYMTRDVTVYQREAVYMACFKLVGHLQRAIRQHKHEGSLTEQLYKRLWRAAVTCDGFTVTMKDNIAFLTGLPEEQCQRDYNMPRLGNLWVHTYSLVPKMGAPLDVIDWYIATIREETMRKVEECAPHIQEQLFKEGGKTCLYHGFLYKDINLPKGPDFDNMTLAELADREFIAVNNILRAALT